MSSKRKLAALYFSVSDVEKERIEDAFSIQKMHYPNLDRSDFLRKLVFAALDAQTETLGAQNATTRRAIDQLTEQLDTLMVLSIATLRVVQTDSAHPHTKFVQLLHWAKQQQETIIKTITQLTKLAAKPRTIDLKVKLSTQKKSSSGGQP